jgi:hypothetical protein
MGPPVGEPNAGRQESARSNEIAELRHRDASRREATAEAPYAKRSVRSRWQSRARRRPLCPAGRRFAGSMRQAFVHTMRCPADHCSDAIKPSENSSATLAPISVVAAGPSRHVAIETSPISAARIARHSSR